MTSKLVLLLAVTFVSTCQVYAFKDDPDLVQHENGEPTFALRGLFSRLGGGSNSNKPSSPTRQRSGKRKDDPSKLRKQVMNNQASKAHLAQLEAQRRQQQQMAAQQVQQQVQRMSLDGNKTKKFSQQGSSSWGQHISPEQKHAWQQEYIRRINYQ